MRRLLPIAGLVLLLAGCDIENGLGAAIGQSFMPAVPNDPARDVFGVSAPVATSDAATASQLDFKVSQLCTNGADEQQQTLVPAEDTKQFAIRALTCRPYRLSVFQ